MPTRSHCHFRNFSTTRTSQATAAVATVQNFAPKNFGNLKFGCLTLDGQIAKFNSNQLFQPYGIWSHTRILVSYTIKVLQNNYTLQPRPFPAMAPHMRMYVHLEFVQVHWNLSQV